MTGRRDGDRPRARLHHPQDLGTQCPRSRLDYCCDWTDWLGDDVIAHSLWVAESSRLAVFGEYMEDTKTWVWLTGGTAGTTYRVTNRIGTAGGRTDDRSMTVRVKDL